MSRRIYLFLPLLAAIAALPALAQPGPDAMTNPFAGDAAAIEAGERVYRQACLACHGAGGEGERGPALNRPLQRDSDQEIFNSIRNGVPGTAMPGFSGFPVDQTWQLVSYVRSLRGTRSAEAPAVELTGDPKAGEALFFGSARCSNCHEVNGRGGIGGPDLSEAGRNTPDTIRAKILNESTGERRRRRGPTVARGKLPNGDGFRGMVLSQDSFHVAVREMSGKVHVLDKSQVSELEVGPGSLMPTNFGERLSGEQVDDLVAYLAGLRERDFSVTAGAEIPGGLDLERITNAHKEPHNWLTYWGDYAGRHFSKLDQITTENVKLLQAKWAVQLTGDSVLQATPLVVDGIMYTTGQAAPLQVLALDAATGLELWRFERPQKVVNPYEGNRTNRGVAMVGNRLFVGTLDAALLALDARTGRQLWEVQVADTMEGYSITSPPLPVNGKIIVGMSGGEYPTRGFLDAYDPKTGERLWRFYTVPAEGEPGNETWPGDTWKIGGGATWLPGSFDPELNLLYWTVGNPAASMDSKTRDGDNLYTDAVVALDPETGKLVWHYQFTPNDSHDWDSNQDVILADAEWQGKPRKLLLHADRNGFYYVLDRETGEFLHADNYVRQTWNAGFDENGKPSHLPGSVASLDGSEPVYPTLGGGTNWQAQSYDADKKVLYLETIDGGQTYVRVVENPEPGKMFRGGGAYGIGERTVWAVQALDAMTGETKWAFELSRGSLSSGVLATSGGLVFAATPEGNLIALDAEDGKPLWRFQAGAAIPSAPISYAVDGKQYIAVSTGSVLYSFALPE